MASKILEESVHANGDRWDFRCPGVNGSPCGDLATGIPYMSAGWPTKKAALARGQQHFDEHKGVGPMQSLDDFRKDQGLIVVNGSAVELGAL